MNSPQLFVIDSLFFPGDLDEESETPPEDLQPENRRDLLNRRSVQPRKLAAGVVDELLAQV